MKRRHILFVGVDLTLLMVQAYVCISVIFALCCLAWNL